MAKRVARRRTVNMLEAKSNLSRLVEAVELGTTPEIIIARNGRAAAKLVAVGAVRPGKRIGVAKGKFLPPEPDAKLDRQVADLFRALK